MFETFGLYGSISIIVIFYILPFILAVLLPAWLLPQLVARFINRQKLPIPSLLLFTVSLVVLAIFANLFWEFALFNRIYHEWDRTFLPYTFFWHESPSLYGSSWIATHWKQWHLYAIWLVLTELIYISAAFLAYFKRSGVENTKLFRKILVASVIALTILSIVIPQFIFAGMKYLFSDTYNIDYKQVDVACTPSASTEPKIIYTGTQNEWISDISGQNLQQAFKKNLQLNRSQDVLSPDGTMAVIIWEKDLWIHCVHSDGAFKIELPKPEQEVGHYQSGSFPSWSPDSQQMVINNAGDVLLVDLTHKTTEVLKETVAIRDNKVDITAKDRDVMIPPFEFGDADWSPSGTIYYTSFNGDEVRLHELNPKTNKNEIVHQSQNLLAITSGDPTGNWLLLSEQSWATQGDMNNWKSESYFFNTASKQVIEIPDGDISNPVWSPSGQSVAQSTGSWMHSPKLAAFPATILNLETHQSTSVTDMVGIALENQNIKVGNNILVVEIKDFVDESRILLKIALPGSGIDIPRQINAILDMSTNELSILQDYPAETYETHQSDRSDRVVPLKIINTAY
ncbi:MAG: hypothetical protein WDZ94_03825 [Patescibacteria group bacterium]